MSSFQQQQNQNCYEESMIHFKDISTDIVPEEEQMADLLDKDFHTAVLQMFKELKENMKKVKETTYGQNGNIKK